MRLDVNRIGAVMTLGMALSLFSWTSLTRARPTPSWPGAASVGDTVSTSENGRFRVGPMDGGGYGLSILDKSETTARILLYVDDETGDCGIQLRDGQGRGGCRLRMSSDGGRVALTLRDAEPGQTAPSVGVHYQRGKSAFIGLLNDSNRGLAFIECDLTTETDMWAIGVGDDRHLRAGFIHKGDKSGVAVWDSSDAPVVKFANSESEGTEVLLPKVE